MKTSDKASDNGSLSKSLSDSLNKPSLDDFQKKSQRPALSTIDEDVGEVKRSLKHYHLQMIGLGGAIGTGLFLASGGALATAGPAGLFLGFVVVGLAMIGVLEALGEMTTLLPNSGSFPYFGGRFVDASLSFSMGLNYAVSYSLSFASELAACAVVVEYWHTAPSTAVWITIFFIPSVVVLLGPVRFYGESEVYMSIIKILAFFGLVIVSLIITLGGAPKGDRIGFRYWNESPWVQYEDISGPSGRFLGFLSAFVNAIYTYSGAESVVLVSGETRNPVKEIPSVIKKVLWRIMFFYIFGVLLITLTVSCTDPRLSSDAGDASASPFVIAMDNAGIKVLPDILNAVILVSAWSAGNSYLYSAIRTVYSMALSRRIPAAFRRVNSWGLPYVSAVVCLCIGALAYLSASNSSYQALEWLIALTSQGAVLNWAAICLTHIRFRRGLKYQGYSPNDLPYKSKFGIIASWFGMIISFIIAFVQGFDVFVSGKWDVSTFISNYISLLIFFAAWIIWKVVKRSKLVTYKEMDFVTGRATQLNHIELKEKYRIENEGVSIWKRIYRSVF
ncbi:APC amino acid permease [Wallemia mellicola]|nr:APC amino acid permease [Wallemia mellicola]